MCSKSLKKKSIKTKIALMNLIHGDKKNSVISFFAVVARVMPYICTCSIH